MLATPRPLADTLVAMLVPLVMPAAPPWRTLPLMLLLLL
jgi:hypothetical protein